MKKELTIISVYHNRLSKKLLELNGEFTRALNPHTDIEWLVGNNTPAGFTDGIDEKNFVIITNRENYHGLGSHRHAGAINKCLKEVKTRFVLSLDSDFYIVRHGWIKEIIGHMKANDLAFFGVTHHTQDYPKFRYFPAVACMFVDLEKISLETLDFSPQLELTEQKETGRIVRMEKNPDIKKKLARKKIKQFFPERAIVFLGKIMRTLNMRTRRMAIGTARDTSHRIYTRYVRNKRFRREFVSVVFDPYNEPHLRRMVWSPLNRILEMLLPDRLCYVPKDKHSYSATGFKERGYSDLRGFGWEESLWKGSPFGTHIRGSKTWKRNESEDDELRLIRQGLETFIKKDPV